MKTWGVILMVAGLLLTTGCASEKQSVADAPASPNIPSGNDPGRGTDDSDGDGIPDAPGGTGTGENPAQTGFPSGSTAQMTVSSSQLARLFVNSYPNNPQNIRVNIDIRRTRDAVIISYIDNGREVRAGLGTVNPCTYSYNPYPGCTSASSTKYNGWVNQGGQSVWKGFFQDQYGAIVVVIDKLLSQSQGDGQPGNILGGSIWFQNFNKSYPNNPYQGTTKLCWEITLGPYDCRSFMVNNNVQMSSSLYPNNKGPNANTHYELLGEFAGISRAAAGF